MPLSPEARAELPRVVRENAALVGELECALGAYQFHAPTWRVHRQTAPSRAAVTKALAGLLGALRRVEALDYHVPYGDVVRRHCEAALTVPAGPVGRKADHARRALELKVLVALERAGVPLTKSRGGALTRTMLVVLTEAGVEVSTDTLYAKRTDDWFRTVRLLRRGAQMPPLAP